MAASLSQPFDHLMIPSSESGDPEPVKSSLALARQDLARGDVREALRHLRRAAEGADAAGSELRAVALARAAADLATAAGASQAPPPVHGLEPGAPLQPSTAPPTSMVRGNADAALEQLLAAGRAVHVHVKRSARDDGLYIVRAAGSGEPGLGARKAVIVLVEPDDELFAPREP